jgi:hypothetical protein
MLVNPGFHARQRGYGALEMTLTNHHHVAQTTHVLRQRHGVPYELERVVCRSCKKLLSERPVRRAAA